MSSVVAAKELVKTAFAAAVAGSGPDVGPFVERDQRPVMVSLASRGVDEAQIGPARSDRSQPQVVKEFHRHENHDQIQIAGRWR